MLHLLHGYSGKTDGQCGFLKLSYAVSLQSFFDFVASSVDLSTVLCLYQEQQRNTQS